MNRSNTGSHSPRLHFGSPRSIIDLTLTGSKHLPLIKDKLSPNTGRRFFINNQPAKHEEVRETPIKVSQRGINFFDLQAPVDERKLALVKSALEKQSASSSKLLPKRPTPDLEQTERSSIQRYNTNIEMQRTNLSDKTEPIPQRYSVKLEGASLGGDFSSPEASIEPLSASVRSVFDLSSNLNDLSTNENLNELITSLKMEINQSQKHLSSQNKTHMELKLFYEQEIDKHVTKIFQLETLLDKANLKIKEYKGEKRKVAPEMEELKKRHREIVLRIESNLDDVKEQLIEKTQEVSEFQEQLKKSEVNRKRYTEAAKDLESELSILKRRYENLEKKHEELQQSQSRMIEEMGITRSQLNQMAELEASLSCATARISTLEIENKELQASSKLAKDALIAIENTYESSKYMWKEKEISYNSMMQDLLEQVQSEKEKKVALVTENAKLRRALALRDTDSVSNFSKEELNRYQQRISQQEKEIFEGQSEVEKLNKNIEYYEYLLKSKDEIICKLEVQIKNSTEKGSNKKIE